MVGKKHSNTEKSLALNCRSTGNDSVLATVCIEE